MTKFSRFRRVAVPPKQATPMAAPVAPEPVAVMERGNRGSRYVGLSVKRRGPY